MTPDVSRRLILASRSPRRRSLLAEAGYTFEVVAPSDEAEDDLPDMGDPIEIVTRLARQKAANVAGRIDAGIVIGCDTVAACEGAILGKPRDAAHAREILTKLSGREHEVYSGLCLWQVPGDRTRVQTARTRLQMHPLSAEQIEEYLASGLWQGKAGAFGYQDRLGWLEIVEGSESNVVGLPLELLGEMLAEIESAGG